MLPLHARIADKFTLIRSIAHNFADHGGGHKRFLTGRDPLEPTGFVNDYPMVGSMVGQGARGPQPSACRITSPAPTAAASGIDVFSFGSAYLGPSTHPFIGRRRSRATRSSRCQNLRHAAGSWPTGCDDRARLLHGLDRPAGASRPHRHMAGDGRSRSRRRCDLLTSDEARTAFDLSREPAELRERYGMHPWGQRALLARRLVEAGASFVTMVMENPTRRACRCRRTCTYNWDSHAVNCHIFNDAKYACRSTTRRVTALIEDLYARGLDKKVLLIVTGEFGRTPRISYAEGTQTG